MYYDSSVIKYPTLLKIFFAAQDPTQVNGQGNDRGTQYRSIVFYRNLAEKKMAEAFIHQMNTSGHYKKPIAVSVAPLTKFWMAENITRITLNTILKVDMYKTFLYRK